MFWSAGCSLLRAEGFCCSLCVFYGGLGEVNCNFWSKNIKKISSRRFFLIFGHQNPGSGIWIRIRIKSWRIHNPVNFLFSSPGFSSMHFPAIFKCFEFPDFLVGIFPPFSLNWFPDFCHAFTRAFYNGPAFADFYLVPPLQVGSLPHDQNRAWQHAGDRGKLCTDNLLLTLIYFALKEFSKESGEGDLESNHLYFFFFTPVPHLIFFSVTRCNLTFGQNNQPLPSPLPHNSQIGSGFGSVR